MKNLTRVLALVLVFSLMLGSVAFAGTFTDVSSDSANAEAISVLADLGILKGYEDGSFGPEKVITRAEVVAVINRLQGLEQAAKGNAGATPYTDVPADHWASGDINLATQMGVIAGDGDGLFRPEDQVKYEEAVKMVVAALGYTPAVADKGGWPTGYLVIASDKGISKGLNNGAGDPATREIVARLVFQALDAPIMEQVGYGKDATYQAMDGTNGLAKKTMLTTGLHIYKLKGQVVANNTTSIDSATSGISSDEKKIKFTVTDTYSVDMVDDEFEYGEDYIFLVGETTADQNLGYASIAYVQESDNGDWTVLSINEEKGQNVTVTIDNPEDIQYTGSVEYPSSIGSTADPDDMFLSVYNPDEDSDNVEYDLSSTTNVIYNGKYLGKAGSAAVDGDAIGLQGASSELGKLYAPKSGSVTLLDNNRDDVYDYMFVKCYDTAIVDEIYNQNTRIATKLSGIIDLDFANKKDCSYTITLDGEAIGIEDLEEWDVLSVAKTTDSKNYEIIVSRDTVTGAIEQVDTGDINNTDISKFVLDIDGTSYEIATMGTMSNTNISSTISAGDEGTFYLDAFGKIAYFDKSAGSSKNYGFIVSAGKDNSSMDDDYKVRMLDAEGAINDYLLADRVRVYATVLNEQGNPDIVSDSVKAADLFGQVGGTIGSAATDVAEIAALPTLADLVQNGVISADQTEENAADYAERMVTFTVSSEGRLTGITFAADEVAGVNDGGYFTHNGYDATGRYSERTNTIGQNIGITEDTKIFFLPINENASRDDFEVRSMSSLVDDQEYKYVHYYSVDEDGNAGAIMITDVSVVVGESSSLAVITGVGNSKVDGDNVYRISFYQDGEEVTMNTTADLYNELDSSTLVKGAIFGYAESNDEITDMELLGIDAVNYTDFEGMVEAGELSHIYNSSSNDKAQYVFGVVYRKDASRNIQIGAYDGGGNNLARHRIPDSANIYMVDLNKSTSSSSRVTVASYGDIQATYIDPTGNIDREQDYSVFIKYYNDEITDVIVYKGYINKMQ